MWDWASEEVSQPHQIYVGASSLSPQLLGLDRLHTGPLIS